MRARVTALLLAALFLMCGGMAGSALLQFHEKARRLGCQNNLKQIGLSTWNYAMSYRHFPQAAVPNPSLPPERRLSWQVAILPFVEATDQFVHLAKQDGWDAAANRPFAAFPHYVYQCPARHPEVDPDSGLAPTTYVGLAGVGTDAATLPEGDPRAGFFGFDRKLTPADIKGGASRLLLAAETSRTTGTWIAAGTPTVRGLDPNDRPYLGVGRQFGGLHRGGANVLFADGHVDFFTGSTDSAVIEALAKVSGSRVRLDD
jgi:prepilin-type processing-associated H-X9-DG protein